MIYLDYSATTSVNKDVLDSFVKASVIDEYVIGIIPTILGKGINLFYDNNPKIDLKLEYYAVEDGIVIMKYSKRK